MTRFVFDLQRFNDIENEEDNVLITGTSGNDSIYNSGNNVTIKSGYGVDTVTNYGNFVSIVVFVEDDVVDNIGQYTTIDCGQGNDSVYNHNDNVTINGDDGNDIIYNSHALNVLINGGADNDSIENQSAYVSIKGGAGNDKIKNHNASVSIDGGSGKDYIYSNGNKVTITGGTGDDTISLGSSASLNVINYTSGDGNDSINGFSTNTRLLIGGGNGTYYSTRSGSDIIVTVGNSAITLKNAANLSYVNIFGTYVNPFSIVGTAYADTFNNTLSGATIQALNGNDSICNDGSDVIINAGDGDDSILNGDYFHDTWHLAGSNVTISGGEGNDYIKSGYYGDSESVSISGGEGNDFIENNGSKVTISGDSGDDIIKVETSSRHSSIDGGDGNDSIYNSACDVTINAGAGNDTIENWGDDVTIKSGDGNDNIKIVYSGAMGCRVSIESGNGDDTITNEAYHCTLSGGAGNDLIILDSSSFAELIRYTSGDGNDLISGFDETSTLQIGGGSGTYSSQKSGSDVIVTVGNGKITLSDAANLSTVNIDGNEIFTDPVWTLNGTTAEYGTSSKTLVTVNSVKSTSGLKLSDKTVTVSNASLNKKNVTISDGYKLALGSDVTKSKTTAAGWTLNDTTATYKTKSTTAGYKLASNKISYVKASGGETLATLNGFNSTSGLKFDGKTITVSNASLNKKTVTLNGDGFTLKLGDDVTNSKTTAAGWTLSGTTATYKSASTTAGYKLASNKISYVKASGGATLFKINGIKLKSSDLSVSGNITSGTATYTTSGNDVIFTVGGGKITVKGAKNKTFTYTDAGGTHNYTPDVDDKPYTIDGAGVTLLSSYTKNNFDVVNDVTDTDGKSIVTINASAVKQGIEIIGNSKANSIIGGKGNDTLEGDAKNDTLTGGTGNDVFVYYNNSGNDVITDYSVEDTIHIANGTINTIKSSGVKDVVFTIGKGILKVQGALNKGITYIDADDYEHDLYKCKQVVTVKGTTVTVAKNFWKESFDVSKYGDGLKQINATAISKSIEIIGNEEDNIIRVGKGKCTVRGGAGDDVIYGDPSGGAIVYVYNQGDGKDTIYNYRSEDKIVITTKGKVKPKSNGKDVTLSIGEKGKIVLENAAGKDIQYVVNGQATLYSGYDVDASNDVDVAWFLEDEGDFSGADNQLSSIIRDGAASSYSMTGLDDTFTFAAKNSSIPALTYSSNK